jgi:hypothetical protein
VNESKIACVLERARARYERSLGRLRLAKLVVLFAFVIVLAVLMGLGAVGHSSARAVDENLRNTYSTGSWTNIDCVAYEMVELVLAIVVNVLGVLALGFAGLCLGSMRKSSAKTEE